MAAVSSAEVIGVGVGGTDSIVADQGSGSSQNPSDPQIINLRGFGDLIGSDLLNGCPLDIDSVGGVAQQTISHLRGNALGEADELNHRSDLVSAGEAGNLEDHRDWLRLIVL